jgi:hypothetical protein
MIAVGRPDAMATPLAQHIHHARAGVSSAALEQKSGVLDEFADESTKRLESERS